MKVSHLSTEAVLIPVQEIVNGIAVDVTTYPVEIALIDDNDDPESADWNVGTWETNSLSGEYDASVIVGPAGTVTLVAGRSYRPWVRVTAPAEQPVLRCPGLIRVN